MGWACGLEKRSDQREWVLATLMLEFAMRNGDAERLRWSDFRVKDGSAVLCYTPHKTRLSSSGDDIRTVMRYYADPSAVHVENVRVVDLL